MTPKQKLFVKEYLVDLNATRAAIAAGYSEATAYAAGSRLLKHVEVASKIASKTQKRTENLEISADYVLENIKSVVTRCLVKGKDFDPFAALKGLELLGKYRKLFTDKIEHTGKLEHEHRTFDAEKLSDEQLAEAERLIESAHVGSDQG